MTFFSIGSTVTPVCRSHASARSIWSRDALELDRDQAHLLRDASAADIEHQVEFFDQTDKESAP